MVNVYVEPMSDFHKPMADACMYYFELKTDVECVLFK